MEYYNGILLNNRKESTNDTHTWTNLKIVTLRERSQTKMMLFTFFVL